MSHELFRKLNNYLYLLVSDIRVTKTRYDLRRRELLEKRLQRDLPVLKRWLKSKVSARVYTRECVADVFDDSMGFDWIHGTKYDSFLTIKGLQDCMEECAGHF